VSPLSSPMSPVPSSQSAANSAPDMVPIPVALQSSPTTPVSNTPNAPSFGNSVQYPQAIPAQPQSSMPPVVPSSPMWRRRNGLLITLIAILIVVLLGSGFGGFYWLTHKSSAVVTNQIVGHAFFVSSEQISEHNNQGINDELIIDLQNIPSPATNKSYYAWLLGDADQPLTSPILLGPLTVSGGRVHVVYKGDSHHTNLIGITSRFLITEEDANIHPNNPSPDQSNWRYFAELPQRASSSTSTPTSMGTSTPSTSAMGS